MATTAGALSQVSVSSNTASLSSAVATAGTAPYTYQWYRSTTTGFSPGPGSLISGATALTLSDSALVPNSVYFYKVVATDSSSPAVTGTSSQLSVTTTGTQLSQNAFVQAPIVGQTDMNFNSNTMSVQVDVTAPGTVYQGQAMKIVANTLGGIPKVIPCTAITDSVIGFVNYNVKNVSFAIGQNMEISSAGNVIWLYANSAITQGARVCLDTAVVGGVQATGSTANVVGWAMDGAAAAGALIRVHLTCPSFANA